MKDHNPNPICPQRVLVAATGLLFLQAPLHAYDLDDKLSVGGILAVAGQCQALDQGAGKQNACRGALPLRPQVSFRPTGQDEFYAELGFAAGNGLNKVSPFQLSPWGADLEDDMKDINGRGRSYLLTSWYRHDFRLTPDNLLSATLGIIDSSDYLDNNAFANDEYTQFMNEALVNSPQVFLPSYDLGAAVRWDFGVWSLRAVYMNVGKDQGADDGDQGKATKLTDRDLGGDYDYLGAEIGYSVRTPFGVGNYRLVASSTSRDFVDPRGMRAERRSALALSFDQELGDVLGVFIRIDDQSDDAAINYDSAYAGGLDIRGNLWGRERDNIGLGIALMNGGNQGIESTRVAEAYYRLVLHEQYALTADLQHMKDDKTSGKDPEGFIFGLRADLRF